MQLGYFFWDNFKKTGFAQGKLVKKLYEKQVVEGKKSSNSFIDEQTESIMKTERQKTTTQVNILTQEINNSEKNIQNIQITKNDEKRKIKDNYSEQIDTLTNEKKRIESCFSTYTTGLSEKAKATEELFTKLTESLGKFAEDTKEYISKQSARAKDSLDSILNNTKNFLLDDIKRDYLAHKAKDETEEKKPALKSWIYSIILVLLCSFDIVAGYISLNQENMGQPALNLFIAILMVAIGMILVYFSGREMKKEGGSKQIGLACIIIVFLIFAIYTILALELGTRENIINYITQRQFKEIIISFMNDSHLTFFILRLLILPALFVGDILIKMIDTDALFASIPLGKGISKLLDKGVSFFKTRNFTKHVEEEKKQYGEILEGLKDTPIPGSEDILFQIEKLESKVMPISNELITKRNECEAKIKDIDIKIKEILSEENAKLDNIDKFYASIITKEEINIARNTAMINALNEQLGKAEIAVREGIGLGLID